MGESEKNIKSREEEKMSEVVTEIKQVSAKKRGRRRKDEVVKYELDINKKKFFVDLSKDQKGLEDLHKFLIEVNNKDFGREVILADIVMYFIRKATAKDIDKIKDEALSIQDKLKRDHQVYVEKSGNKVDFWEYLIINQKK